MTALGETILFTFSWIALAIVGIAIFLFGLVTVAVPSFNDTAFVRSVGVASMGMGLFGFLITTRSCLWCSRSPPCCWRCGDSFLAATVAAASNATTPTAYWERIRLATSAFGRKQT